MSNRTTWLLVLAALLPVIAGLIVAFSLWPPDVVPAPDSEGCALRTEASPSREATPAKPETAPAALPDLPVPTPQAEAEALQRDAVGIAGKLVEEFPEDAVTYALLSAAQHNRGNSDEAVKWLRKCLELDPNRADAYGMLAKIASEEGDLEQTVALCKEALKRNPAMRDVQHRLGRALMDLGETDELIRTMEQAVKIPPRSSESHYLLGQGYLQSGDYAKAKESFQIVVGMRPDHTQAYFGLFTACTRLRQQDEAAAYGKRFQELEAIDRNAATDRNVGEATLSGLPMVCKTVAKTYAGAAQIYHVHKNFAQAEELLCKAAGLDPNNTISRAALMALCMQQGREAHALKLFEQLAKQQPDNGVNYFYLGQLLLQARQFDAAEKAYQKVTELSPERPEGYRALAEFYLRANRNMAKAQTLVEKVVQLRPSGPDFFLLAVACAKNQDLDGARVAMGRAVELDPDNADYRRFYARLKKEQ
jgi:tetratricopeptide (TPR) repeat protein